MAIKITVNDIIIGIFVCCAGLMGVFVVGCVALPLWVTESTNSISLILFVGFKSITILILILVLLCIVEYIYNRIKDIVIYEVN